MSLSSSGEGVCCHCGASGELQAVFSGQGNSSILLCPECLDGFLAARELNSLFYGGNDTIKEGVRLILRGLNEMYHIDLQNLHLVQTPQRVSRMFAELCSGYYFNPDIFLKVRYPVQGSPGLIVVRDIEFTSLCVHHLSTIVGKVHVGYVPGQWYVGLSKIARVADAYARRLQIQELMTDEIADCIQRGLSPQGVMVVVEARHDCMCKRGVTKPDALTVTSAVRGVFFDNTKDTKGELLHLLLRGD